MFSSLDVLPTVVAAVGGKLPAHRVLDGHDIAAVLAGRSRSPHHALHWVWDPTATQQWRGMREGDFKLVRRSNHSAWQLYDLGRDPGEANDLATSRPEVLKTMVQKLEIWHLAIRPPTR